MNMISGSLLNFTTIVIGSCLGLLLKFLSVKFAAYLPAGSARLGERIRVVVMQGISLCVFSIGVSGALKDHNTLISILSMVLGALAGELLDLDSRMRSLGEWVQRKTERLFHVDADAPSVSDGFVAATLLFCVGAMAIVGALENGLTGKIDTLQAKSLLDGITSVVLASSLGIGVILSAAAVLLYQGSISLLASLVSPFLSNTVITEMACVGSLLIVALALNMLGVTKIKVMNLVPAIFFPIFICLLA